MSRDFQPPFYYDSNPSRPLINRLKYFRTRFRFHQDIQIFKKLRSVHPTVESSSVVCIPPLSQAPSCASHHGVKKSKFLKKLCGVQHTAKSNCTLRSQNWNICESLVKKKKKKRFEEILFDLLSLKFCLRNVMHTAESKV